MSFLKFLITKAFLKQLLYAVLVLIVLCFLILWWLRSTTNHGQQIEVPDMAKMDLMKVEETLDELDLRYEVIDSANYNPEYPHYSVIEQFPNAGNLVKENRKIYLTLNPSGYRKIVIPPVVGKTKRQVEPTLKAIGFNIGKISTRRYIAKDEVLELRHKGSKVVPGDELPKTAVIDLIIGDGSGSLRQQENNEVQEGSGGEGAQNNDDGGN